MDTFIINNISMTKQEQIEFYAKAYNTIQEIVRTEINEELETDCFGLLDRFLEELDGYINSKYSKKDKENFLRLTDNIRDRIYFNI